MTDRTERSKRDEAPEFLEANETRDELTPTPAAATSQASDEQEAQDTLTLGKREAAPAHATKPRRVSRKGSKQAHVAKLSETEIAAARAAAEAAERANVVTELESQGFSNDEARRLIDISKRLEHSAEAQETRRLRFTRWLVEQGILNEFSA